MSQLIEGVRINREELAWAAGLFDGEGHTRARKNGTNGTYALTLSLDLANQDVLERFHKAVWNLGTLRGPYSRKRQSNKPLWRWQATKFEYAQAIIAAIWSFLSPPKKEQIKSAIETYNSQPHPGKGRGKG